MAPSTDTVRVLVTLERSVVDDAARLHRVCRAVEQHLVNADRGLLRFGILFGEIARSELPDLADLPGILSVEIDEPKSAIAN